jgi:hypothetical protein
MMHFLQTNILSKRFRKFTSLSIIFFLIIRIMYFKKKEKKIHRYFVREEQKNIDMHKEKNKLKILQSC